MGIDLSKLKTSSIKSRKHKFSLDSLAKPLPAGSTFGTFIDSLPDELAARDLKVLITNTVKAKKNGKPVILGMGAHPIKVGISPLIIDLIENGTIDAIATNGASMIHDFELALAGSTSEDVAAELRDGSFGMARETGEMLNSWINNPDRSLGLGACVGKMLDDKDSFPYTSHSILAAASRKGIPCTVHVAIATDTIHWHPSFDGAATGERARTDFLNFCNQVAGLNGGVFINLGSAVIIPEIFLKALTVCRNLGHKLDFITTANFDFIKQYRPITNVVSRPTMNGGTGLNFVGHHEIMFPLLAAALKENISQ